MVIDDDMEWGFCLLCETSGRFLKGGSGDVGLWLDWFLHMIVILFQLFFSILNSVAFVVLNCSHIAHVIKDFKTYRRSACKI